MPTYSTAYYVMVTIYQSYDDEPPDVFNPLPEQLAAEFYALEMDGFTADIQWYLAFLAGRRTLLELGSGTGRLAAGLAGGIPGQPLVIGIDLSLPMLQRARQSGRQVRVAPRYLCMDMTRLALAIRFDAILIAYNTLNLLGSEETILSCLDGCRRQLAPGGLLLVQLFVATGSLIERKKTFQFQILDRQDGGRVIKEMLRTYEPQSETLRLEERFRVRPLGQGQEKEDWNCCRTLAAFSAERWLAVFARAGFQALELHGDYQGNPYSAVSSTLLGVFAVKKS